MTAEELLRPGEAARQALVSTETLRRWAAAGLIEVVVLPSGSYRYPASEIRRILHRRPSADPR